MHDTVDGRYPANQLRLVVYPIIYRVFYIPGGCLGFLPSTFPASHGSFEGALTSPGQPKLLLGVWCSQHSYVPLQIGKLKTRPIYSNQKITKNHNSW